MKENFVKIYTENIHRDGSGELLGWLERSDFFTAPASAKYHCSHEGGLCEHSVNVFHRLEHNLSNDDFKINFDHNPEYPGAESVAICGLLHDVCKANFYKSDIRNIKNESGTWEKVPYYAIEEKFPFGHGEKSVFLIERFMKLTVEEAVAIRFHMGEFESCKSTPEAFRKYPLALMLHIADMQATFIDEREGN